MSANYPNEASVQRTAFLPYGQQWLDEHDINSVLQVLRGDLITQGPMIPKFEQKVADYVGTTYAVAFTNGTAALHGACFAAGIGPGDEVITTPMTFIASSNCVLYQGGTPVFADIDPQTYNINPDQVERLITPNTRAIIGVDFTGQPVEADRLRQLAVQHQLVFIEDAAHSIGASYKGTRVGKWADMTMFSFHPVKHVTTGEGGIIVTDNEEYYRKLVQFRNHGMTKEPAELLNDEGGWYYEMQTLGFNYRMTDLQAALGVSQMDKLDSFIKRRREIVDLYQVELNGLEGIVLPYQAPETESSWHLYSIRWLPEHFHSSRRELFDQLRKLNIGVHVHYIPVYLHPYYEQLGYPKGLCPIAEEYYSTCMTLPLFPKMTEQDVRDVCQAVRWVHQNNKINL